MAHPCAKDPVPTPHGVKVPAFHPPRSLVRVAPHAPSPYHLEGPVVHVPEGHRSVTGAVIICPTADEEIELHFDVGPAFILTASYRTVVAYAFHRQQAIAHPVFLHETVEDLFSLPFRVRNLSATRRIKSVPKCRPP